MTGVKAPAPIGSNVMTFIVRRNAMDTVTRDKLVEDVKDVLNDVEQLMRQAASAGEGQAAELRERAASALERAQGKLDGLQRDVRRATREAVQVTDHWVHQNPWSSIGMAAGVGILIGVLVGRR
jgi:ElaB/YqjD/DUF883 family membrane-anchored ribosome-binding protein